MLFHYSLRRITKLEPPRYKLIKAEESRICVKGSVDGVIIAAINVQITITYFHADNIFFPVTIPNNPRATCIAGIWNATPVANNKTDTKLKYCSNAQKGSTTSEP